MIVGLAGYAQTGKDTVANVLRCHGFTRLSFADALKDEMAVELAAEMGTTFQVAREWLDDTVVKEEFRDRMVALGKAKRAENPDCLIDILRPQWFDGGDYVITDCRYLNEIREVEENGGVWLFVVKFTKDNGTEHESKPANEEERQSFGEIVRAVEDGELMCPADVWRAEKGRPDVLEAKAEQWIREYRS